MKEKTYWEETRNDRNPTGIHHSSDRSGLEGEPLKVIILNFGGGNRYVCLYNG